MRPSAPSASPLPLCLEVDRQEMLGTGASSDLDSQRLFAALGVDRGEHRQQQQAGGRSDSGSEWDGSSGGTCE